MNFSGMIIKLGNFTLEKVVFLPITLAMRIPPGWWRLVGLVVAVPFLLLFMLLALPLMLFLGLAELAFGEDKP